MHLRRIKWDKIIDLLNWLGIPLICLYFFSMFVYPWIDGGGSWSHVHSVWMDWQTINVGVLAFVSSMVAFNISKYHTKQQREREFIAARSFLPEALSELVRYFKSSAILLTEAWKRTKDEADQCNTPLSRDVPELPTNYREIFSRCISLAEPNVAKYLSYILMQLQVHHARMENMYDAFQPNSSMRELSVNIKSYLFRLAELQALINRIFDYSRGLEDFNNAPLTWDEFKTAYVNLEIRVHEFEDLEDFTKRAIDREKNRGYTIR